MASMMCSTYVFWHHINGAMLVCSCKWTVPVEQEVEDIQDEDAVVVAVGRLQPVMIFIIPLWRLSISFRRYNGRSIFILLAFFAYLRSFCECKDTSLSLIRQILLAFFAYLRRKS